MASHAGRRKDSEVPTEENRAEDLDLRLLSYQITQIAGVVLRSAFDLIASLALCCWLLHPSVVGFSSGFSRSHLLLESSVMTTVQHHVVTQTHSSTNHLDNQLDALLDDLQTSVSRSGVSTALSPQNGPLLNGSSFGGHINLPPGASGYREITTTVTRDGTNGVPMTSREYQIEYLNPANSVTVLDDRSSSPAMDLLKSGELSGHQVKSYKTETYDYKFSKTTSDRKVSGYTEPQPSDASRSHMIESKSYHQSQPQIQDESQFSRTENFRSDTNVGKNLNELDMLLKELNNSPSSGPGGSSSSGKTEHVQTIEITKSPERYGDSSSSREMNYSERSHSRNMRAQSPMVSSKSPARTINVQREYNTMESRGHTSRRDSPGPRSRSSEMSPTLRRRTPSPSSGEFRTSNFSNYPISSKDLTPTRTTTKKTYNYSSTSRRTPTPTTFDEPQPYRSPSPVSFPQKRSPSPARKSLNRSDSGRTVSYQVSPPMSENPTVITYKYSSHSREQSRYPGGGYDDRDQDEPITRPFPTSTPIPAGEQNPPKKLDELMASFQDSKSRNVGGGEYPQGSSEYRHHVEYSRESREKHGGELQRSPSFEKNLRPSNVKVTQSYSQQQQQQQQNQEYQNQYQHKEQYSQRQYQQREHAGSYQNEFERNEEYQTREHPDKYQQQQREQYQREQYQQYQQNQGGYHREHREQYQQNQEQYNQNQRYQYQQQQYQQQQQNSFQMPVNESASSSQAYRSASASRSVAGPPVYYPPGVELFTKKEEAQLMQEQSGGKGKSKGKSKSKYEKSEKGKDKGKKVVGAPVCLPVCCAMPCSIM